MLYTQLSQTLFLKTGCRGEYLSYKWKKYEEERSSLSRNATLDENEQMAQSEKSRQVQHTPPQRRLAELQATEHSAINRQPINHFVDHPPPSRGRPQR
jgi:hypothetical protein